MSKVFAPGSMDAHGVRTVLLVSVWGEASIEVMPPGSNYATMYEAAWRKQLLAEREHVITIGGHSHHLSEDKIKQRMCGVNLGFTPLPRLFYGPVLLGLMHPTLPRAAALPDSVLAADRNTWREMLSDASNRRVVLLQQPPPNPPAAPVTRHPHSDAAADEEERSTALAQALKRLESKHIQRQPRQPGQPRV